MKFLARKKQPKIATTDRQTERLVGKRLFRQSLVFYIFFFCSVRMGEF